jgi:hypothetical protein
VYISINCEGKDKDFLINAMILIKCCKFYFSSGQNHSLTTFMKWFAIADYSAPTGLIWWDIAIKTGRYPVLYYSAPTGLG